MRVGWGVDVHRFDDSPPVLLGGVAVHDARGLEGHSDGDVLAHAVADGLLGAVGLGDLGDHFPSDDERWLNADSMRLLASVAAMVRDTGWEPTSVDATIVAQSVRVSPHRDAIRASLAAVLELGVDTVSVKATTTDGLGFVGRDEGMAALAVVVVRSADR